MLVQNLQNTNILYSHFEKKSSQLNSSSTDAIRQLPWIPQVKRHIFDILGGYYLAQTHISSFGCQVIDSKHSAGVK